MDYPTEAPLYSTGMPQGDPTEGLPIYASQEEADAAGKAKEEAIENERKQKLVDLARTRFSQAEEAESEVRKLADEDIRFRAGEQWNTADVTQRKIDKRPMLVINRIPQFERQITNESRQSKPAMQISPVDSGADKETAEVIQGLIRHIEYDSGADVAYDTALTSAVRGGFGYFRIVSEYEGEGSFEQCLKIKRVRDPSSVYLDPTGQEPDGSDASWGFVVDDGMSTEEFKAQHPDVEPSAGGWGNRQTTNGHTCQVVEYFYKERVPDELVHMQPVVLDENGQPEPDGPPIIALRSELPPAGLTGIVLNTRPTHRTKVCWAKIAGSTVVEEREFPSKWVPLIPVLGDELWVDGKRILEGVVRHAKDPQRMYNFWSTAITETIALAPKAPWIGAEGAFEGHEKEWAKAATQNVAYLQYRIKVIGNQMAPPPARNAFEAPIAAMTSAMQFASEDMKATTGIYDAALGNRSNETSGVAIRGRQQQSQISSLHFSDNLARALRHAGRILIDAIPRVYSGPRVVRILGEDQTEKLVAINSEEGVEGQKRIYDLGTGKYDVTVSMGPSFTSKRQESVAAMTELSRGNPQMAQSIMDLLVRNMDWPGAQQIADRLKKMLPPGLAEPDEKEKQDPAALAQQLQGAMQQNQQLTAALNEAQTKLDSNAQDNETKERIELMKLHVDLMKTAATLDAEDQRLLMRDALAIRKRLGMPDLQPEPEPMPQPIPQPKPMNGAPNGIW